MEIGLNIGFGKAKATRQQIESFFSILRDTTDKFMEETGSLRGEKLAKPTEKHT